jgi:hypothetical protein
VFSEEANQRFLLRCFVIGVCALQLFEFRLHGLDSLGRARGRARGQRC